MKRLGLLPLLLLLGCEALWGRFNKPHLELAQASRSSTIAISQDDGVLVLVNPEHGSISIFEPTTLARTAVVPTGRERCSVVLHPDGDTAFVANRADATVVKVVGLRSPTPTIAATAQVGSEPSGLALSPRGRRLFVAEFGESSIAVLDTDDLSPAGLIKDVANPRAVTVTNNLDGQDDDELLVVPHYFGEPQPGGEAQNSGRAGRIDLFSLRDLAPAGSIPLPPLSAAMTGTDAAGPNQLAGAAIAPDGRLYVTDLAASPAPPLAADHNVTPVVHVVDLVNKVEVTQGAGTTSLPRQLSQLGNAATLFLADPVDIEFVHDKRSVGFVGYVVSRGTDAVERIVFDPDRQAVSIGSLQNLQIDASGDERLGRCRAPSGGAVAFKTQRMFLNCWLSRRLAVLDLNDQTLQSTFPTVDTEPLSASVLSGMSAFYSARGRMAASGRMSCASCHPDGRSDGITWSFPTGPRQTPSLDSVFSHHGSPQTQRILGFTANADEVADFEDLLRNVMGGHGAISTAAAPADCGDLSKETPVTLNAALGAPNRDLQKSAGSCASTWDDIESYLTTLRPVRRQLRVDPESVARGAALFGNSGQSGGCIKCHSESGWTLSRRFYTPAPALLSSLASTVRFTRPSAWPSFYTFHDGGTQIEVQPAAAESPAVTLPPPQLSCAVRNVSTFAAGGAASELTSAGARAQGRGGYSIPGLYSLAVTPPFLHHGQATTLDALLKSPEFAAHLASGAANFDVMDAGARQDLLNFLLSVDGDSDEQTAPAGFSAGCATN